MSTDWPTVNSPSTKINSPPTEPHQSPKQCHPSLLNVSATKPGENNEFDICVDEATEPNDFKGINDSAISTNALPPKETPPCIPEECVSSVEIGVSLSEGVLNMEVDFNQMSMEEESLPEKRSKENHVLSSNYENTKEQSFCYDWTSAPKLLTSATEEYLPTASCENFTKDCQWSPDGTCLLVPSEDFKLRIYELPRELYTGQVSADLSLPHLKPALSVKEGGLIYDSCWYPLMSSWDPPTCCFASTSQESPIHLWDAFTGELRATYRPYNLVDEVEAAISVQFVESGKAVWCGFKNALRMFDTNRPGRQTDTIFLKKNFPNVTGLVSCIRENPVMPGLIAFGTYSKCIGLYKDGPLCAFKTGNGVTQIEFSPCGTKLFSSVRRSNELLCWDLRNPGVVLWSLEGRQSDTNQRIKFSLSADGNEIVSGGTDGIIKIWHTAEYSVDEEDLQSKYKVKLSEDCINGVSSHKRLPILATSSGQRMCDTEERPRDNSVRLWWFSHLS